MTALALPRIGPQVPRAIVPGPLLAANGTVSRFLLDADAFEAADLPPTWSDSLQACQRALDRWLKRQIGPLHCLAPRFELRMVKRDGGFGDYYDYGRPPPRSGFAFDAVEACWGEYSEQEWPVGEALAALGRQVHGLDGVVLHVLRRQCTFVYPLFTPDIACDVATYLYWCGEQDEEAALDAHCGDDPADREAMRADMVTKAMLEEAYPAWARRWPRRLEPPQVTRFLRRALTRLSDPTAKAVTEDALALARLSFDDSFRPEVDGEFVGFGAVLSWSEGDITTRIYDDLLNLAHQAEHCNHMGEVRVPLDDPGGFAAWQRLMAGRFEGIRLIDRLIHRLSEGDWPRR